MIGLELLDAGFAAEFDLLAVIDLGDGAAHAVEIGAAHEAFGKRVGLGFLCGSGGFRSGAGGEREAHEGGGKKGAECCFHYSCVLEFVWVFRERGGSQKRMSTPTPGPKSEW